MRFYVAAVQFQKIKNRQDIEFVDSRIDDRFQQIDFNK